MQRVPHRRSRSRRVMGAAVVAGTMAASLLGGNAMAGPYPEPPSTTLSLPSPPGGKNVKVLVFHGSTSEESPIVNAGIEAIEKIGLSGPAAQRFKTETNGDGSVFTNATKLGRYNAVVFLTGGGDVLDPEQEAGLEAFVEAGGGFLGIRDAARTEPYSEWFTGLIGARPGAASPDTVQRATVEVGDRRHPATKNLPRSGSAPTSGSTGTRTRPATCTPWPGSGRAPTSRARVPTARITRSPGAVTTTAAVPSTPVWAPPSTRTPRPTSATTCAAPFSGPPASRGPTARRPSPPTTRRSASLSPTNRASRTRSASRTAPSSRPTAASSTSAAAAATTPSPW